MVNVPVAWLVSVLTELQHAQVVWSVDQTELQHVLGAWSVDLT
jgi:hypothetical protein